MCAVRVNRMRTSFHYFLLELDVHAHTLRIVPSGNDAPKIVPDKSLENHGLLFKMVVAICGRHSHLSLGIAMVSRRFIQFTKHGLNHVLFVFKRSGRGTGGRHRGGAFVLLDCQETISEKAMTASEGDSQMRM